MNLPELVDNCCSKCGSDSMTLAEDFTRYSPCQFIDGWQKTYSDMEPSGAEMSVRFFCADCGTQHAVPKELP